MELKELYGMKGSIITQIEILQAQLNQVNIEIQKAFSTPNVIPKTDDKKEGK
jgi:hypothetical protein